MEQRKQFTFYRSYYEAIAKLDDPLQRAEIYEILIQYALDGTEPDPDSLPGPVSMAYLLIRPTLDASRRKAMSGKRGGEAEHKEKLPASKQEANSEQTGREKEIEEEKEKELENEIEKEYKKESYTHASDFARFWASYPRKEGRAEAERAFGSVRVGIEVILSALERQKRLPQWQLEGGRYIPLPAKWLQGRRWEDKLFTPSPPQKLGDLELQAIRRIMSS